MEKSVVGVYKSNSNAQNAVNELLGSGFTRDQIYIQGKPTRANMQESHPAWGAPWWRKPESATSFVRW